MKHPFLMTLVAVSVVLTAPASVAQTWQSDGSGSHNPGTAPPGSAPANPETFLLYPSQAPLPNRRTPSLAPPQRDEDHPVSPDEAWPKDPDTRQPLLPHVEPGAEDEGQGSTLMDSKHPGFEGSELRGDLPDATLQ